MPTTWVFSKLYGSIYWWFPNISAVIWATLSDMISIQVWYLSFDSVPSWYLKMRRTRLSRGSGWFRGGKLLGHSASEHLNLGLRSLLRGVAMGSLGPPWSHEVLRLGHRFQGNFQRSWSPIGCDSYRGWLRLSTNSSPEGRHEMITSYHIYDSLV